MTECTCNYKDGHAWTCAVNAIGVEIVPLGTSADLVALRERLDKSHANGGEAIAALTVVEAERDLALAKSESYKRSRDDWKSNWQARARKTVELRRENAGLRDVLAYFVAHWPVGTEKKGEQNVKDFDDMFQRGMELTGMWPFPLKDTTGAASDHAPDAAIPPSDSEGN